MRFKLKSISIKLALANSCMIMPKVIIGVIPSSMSVTRFEARAAHIQYNGSDESDDMNQCRDEPGARTVKMVVQGSGGETIYKPGCWFMHASEISMLWGVQDLHGG